MIHVFRTSVATAEQVEELRPTFSNEIGHAQWSFDLDDCDHILRVANSSPETAERCMRILKLNGFTCDELPD